MQDGAANVIRNRWKVDCFSGLVSMRHTIFIIGYRDRGRRGKRFHINYKIRTNSLFTMNELLKKTMQNESQSRPQIDHHKARILNV